VRHAYNLAEAFRAEGIKAQGVSGETPKRELAEILARYERGDIDVLINAQLLAEGWEQPSRNRPACTWRRRLPSASTSSAWGRVTAGTRARRRGWSWISCTPPPSTTIPWSRCTRCSTGTSTVEARSSSVPCAADAGAACGWSGACFPCRGGGAALRGL